MYAALVAGMTFSNARAATFPRHELRRERAGA